LGEVLASEDLTEEEIKALRDFLAREVLRNLSGAFGMVTASQPAVSEKPYPAWAAAHVIGKYSGAIRVTFIDPTGKWSDGLSLTYWLLEAARGPEGLKVKVAVETERKEGVLFVIEGVVPSGKV
jgi:hypothetical protein